MSCGHFSEKFFYITPIKGSRKKKFSSAPSINFFS